MFQELKICIRPCSTGGGGGMVKDGRGSNVTSSVKEENNILDAKLGFFASSNFPPTIYCTERKKKYNLSLKSIIVQHYMSKQQSFKGTQ